MLQRFFSNTVQFRLVFEVIVLCKVVAEILMNISDLEYRENDFSGIRFSKVIGLLQEFLRTAVLYTFLFGSVAFLFQIRFKN